MGLVTENKVLLKLSIKHTLHTNNHMVVGVMISQMVRVIISLMKEEIIINHKTEEVGKLVLEVLTTHLDPAGKHVREVLTTPLNPAGKPAQETLTALLIPAGKLVPLDLAGLITVPKT